MKALPILLILLLIGAILPPRWVWQLRQPFVYTNQLQWHLMAPWRTLLRDTKSNWPHRVYWLTFPFAGLYTLLAYLLLAPVRLVNAVYFDLLLFWTISLHNGIADLFHLDAYEPSRLKRIAKITRLFPARLARFILRYFWVILQGFLMVAFDLAWPTLTLYHGTSREIASVIARTGTWTAGSGDYAGTGIYFGLDQEVAEHYARHQRSPLVVVVRVTLSPCRAISTLPAHIRRAIGVNGDIIARGVKFPWVSIEHWRSGSPGWYEFCLLQPGKGQFISPWRIRPICIVGDKEPERIVGGLTRWPKNRPGAVTLASTLLALLFILFTPPSLSALGSRAGWFHWETQPVALPQVSLAEIELPAVQFGTPAPPFNCPAAPPLKFANGDQVCVAWLDGDRLRLRAAPDSQTDANVLARLESGIRLRIISGPVCSDPFAWWQVTGVDAVYEGWVAEGSPENYFLESCP